MLFLDQLTHAPLLDASTFFRLRFFLRGGRVEMHQSGTDISFSTMEPNSTMTEQIAEDSYTIEVSCTGRQGYIVTLVLPFSHLIWMLFSTHIACLTPE